MAEKKIEQEIYIDVESIISGSKNLIREIDTERKEMINAVMLRKGMPHATWMNAIRRFFKIKETIWSEEQVRQVYSDYIYEAQGFRSFERRIAKKLLRSSQKNSQKNILVKKNDFDIVSAYCEMKAETKVS